MMLDSLHVKNFKIFKELNLKKLGQVNLISGKNNTGKSCLLEALRVYAHNASPFLLYKLIRERGQDWELNSMMDDESNSQEYELGNHPFRHFFRGNRLPELNSDPIEIGSFNNPGSLLKLYISLYHKVITKDEINFVRAESFPKDGAILEEPELVVDAEFDGSRRPLFKFGRSLRDSMIHGRFSRRGIVDYDVGLRCIVQTVPTRNIDPEIVGYLWDKVSVKPSIRQDVFNAVRLIDNKIQEIVFINRAPRRSEMMPIIIYGEDKQVPMNSLGDGVIHIFHIMLALVNAKDGFLLVDEFENGLHYSIQPNLWRIIFEMAERFNVQVVATTHSLDCISAFHGAWKNQRDAGVFYRLDAYDDEITATCYDVESLGDALELGGEMR